MRKHNFTSKQLWRKTITRRPYPPCSLPSDYDDSLDTTESDNKMDPSLNRINIPPEIIPPHEEERRVKPNKITFSNVAFVYLIPTNEELSEHVDLSFLYWNKLDYLRFKRDAIMQIQNYWKANGKSTNLGLILKEITERSIEENDQIADLLLPPLPPPSSSSFPNIKKAVEGSAAAVVVEKSATSPTSVSGVHIHKDEQQPSAPGLNRHSVPSNNNENINNSNRILNSCKDHQDTATTIEKPVSITAASSSSNDESATSCESSLSSSLSSSSLSSSSFSSPPISADSFDEAQHQQPTVIPSVEEFLHFSLTALDSLHRQLSESHDQQEETGRRELLTS
jgi:hypothetical protein